MKTLSIEKMEKMNGGNCQYIFENIWDPGIMGQDYWIQKYFKYNCHIIDWQPE
jgi:hypothetical protein